MMTIQQYREAIKTLMTKVAEIDTRCSSENREITEAEVALKAKLLDEVDSLETKLSIQERHDRTARRLESTPAPATKPAPTKGIEVGVERESLEKFRTFGQQLNAIMKASTPGGTVDPRLHNVRAATGLGETVPSDGGFLVQTDFSTELLQDVFQTGILASRCRRIPISGNANSLKINGFDETSRASTRFGGIVGYWKDEAALKTASKPKFRQINLQLNKLIGLCYATDELLQDASALEGAIKAGFVSEFGFMLDDAIFNGDGSGKPLGILNAGCLVSVGKETGQAAATVYFQ